MVILNKKITKGLKITWFRLTRLQNSQHIIKHMVFNLENLYL